MPPTCNITDRNDLRWQLEIQCTCLPKRYKPRYLRRYNPDFRTRAAVLDWTLLKPLREALPAQ